MSKEHITQHSYLLLEDGVVGDVGDGGDVCEGLEAVLAVVGLLEPLEDGWVRQLGQEVQVLHTR